MQPLFGEQLRKTCVLLSEMCPEWTLAEQQHCGMNHFTHNEEFDFWFTLHFRPHAPTFLLSWHFKCSTESEYFSLFKPTDDAQIKKYKALPDLRSSSYEVFFRENQEKPLGASLTHKCFTFSFMTDAMHRGKATDWTCSKGAAWEHPRLEKYEKASNTKRKTLCMMKTDM